MATLLSKALKDLAMTVQKASRGSLSTFVPNAPPQYGQPLPDEVGGDAQGLITPQRMREIAVKVPSVSAAINAIMDFTDGVELTVRNTDPAQPTDMARLAHTQSFIDTPNPQDTSLHFYHKLRYDIVTLGFGAVEIERDSMGMPANLWVLDAARLRVDYDEHGTIKGYDMIDARGMPITSGDGTHAWLPEDVILYLRDPMSSTQYSNSRIAQLFTCAIVESLMLHFISMRFTDSNIPVGVYDLGEITEDELRTAIASWNSQASKEHRILLTGSKGSKWYPFGYHLKDLEATQLLATVRSKIMGILGVTMNEMGEAQDVNKSNGYNLSFTFKKRAVEPVLNEVCLTTTRRLLWEELNYRDMEYSYEEIDSRDELIQSEIDKNYLQTGTYTFNHVRNRKGLPSEPGGDLAMVFTGTAWVPVSMLEAFAQAQLDALNAVVTEAAAGGAGGPGAGSISAPITRPPKEPMGMTTPDGAGSSAVKVKYPRGQPQKPSEGTVQTRENMGARTNGR